MSDDKNLPTRPQNPGTVQLHENGLKAGSLIEQSVANLNREQAQNLMAKAGEEALRLEVKNREQNLDYVVGKKVVEDHIDTFKILDKNGKLTSHKVVTDIKTGAGNMRIESKSGATCFVATVAYGDPNHLDVVFLRSFRDQILSRSKIGRTFIALYWEYGPKLAAFVERSTNRKLASRAAISFGVRILRRFL